MEEIYLLKKRDKALKAIIERFPNNDLCVTGDGVVLYVYVQGRPSEVLMFDARTFGTDWKDLMQYLEDRSAYSEPLPDKGYHWIGKKYRRDWTLHRQN